MTLQLLKTDCRRLWPLILLGWLGMAATALPAWRFDLDLYESPMPSFFSSSRVLPATALSSWQSTLLQLRAFMGLGHLALATYLLGVSAALGYRGIAWDGVRPIRRRAFVASKALGLVLFIVGPQLAILESVLLVQGFGVAEMVPLAVRAGGFLIVLHGLSLLFGRLCGSFWTWLAGVGALAGVVSLSMAFRQWHLFMLSVRLDPWAAQPAAWWPVLITGLAVLALLLGFKRRRPVLRVALGCLAIALLPPLAESLRPPVIGIPMKSLPDWDGPVEVGLKQEGLYFDGHLKLETRGLGPGEAVVWWLEYGYPLSSGGRKITQYVSGTRPMPSGSLLPPRIHGSQFTVVPLPESDALPDPEPFLGSDLGGDMFLGHFDADELRVAGDDLSIDARLFGVVARSELVLNVPFGEKGTFEEPGLRMHVELRDKPLPQVAIVGLVAPDGISEDLLHPMTQFRVLVHWPAEGRTEEWRHNGGSRPLLGEMQIGTPYCFHRSVTMRTNGQAPPSPDLTGARVLVYRTKILGKVRRRLQAASLTAPHAQQRPDQVWIVPPGACRWGMNCAATMPDPERCTREQAALWKEHVLAQHDAGGWPRHALAPFVRRFPEIFLRQSGPGWTPLGELLINELPDEAKALVLEAYASEPDTSLTGHLLEVIEARGWLDEARDSVLQHFRADPWHRYQHFLAVCHFEDPSTYPTLVDYLRDEPDLRFYLAARQLPGIQPLLDPAMRELGVRLASQSLPDSSDSWSLRRQLAAPAAHGVPEAFARLWELTVAEYDAKTALEPWRDLASVLVTPTDFGRDPARWHEFLTTHQSADFEHDPLALAWRLKSLTP